MDVYRGNGEVKLVNEGVIGDESVSAIISGNSHLTNKGTLNMGEIGLYDDNNEEHTYSNITAYVWDDVKDGTQAEAEKLVDRMFSLDASGTYNILVRLYWEDENGDEHKRTLS